MKCPFCNGSGVNTTWVATDTVSEFKQTCFKCHGTGEIEQTNEEWFCGLSTEEKARYMCQIYEMGKNGKEYFMRFDKAVEWLKQPHNNE